MRNLSGLVDEETWADMVHLCSVISNETRASDLDRDETVTKDDAAWILANAFLILTMQTGFGMLEAGSVSTKNIANIMVKNVVDVSIGGLAYWALGYGLSFGERGNFFVGWDHFFLSSSDPRTMGSLYARYMFQFSFATAATTIVSGAVAERIKLESYMVYSCLNVFVYCLPARWAWSEKGWLGALGEFSFATAATTIVSGAVAERIKLESYMVYSCLNVFVYCLPARWAWSEKGWLGALGGASPPPIRHRGGPPPHSPSPRSATGFYDFAGATVVHMSGGASALVAALMLGPRTGRFGDNRQDYGMSSPVTALTGTFMLWWAWLAFNAGSTFGISGVLWKTATKAAVNTVNGSIGGSLVGLAASVAMTWNKGRYFDIPTIISSVLGGLVGITAGCSVYTPAESLLIGAIGGVIAVGLMPLLEWLRVDDPVGAVAVHFGSAVWSTLAVGLFAHSEFGDLQYEGLVWGGGCRLLGVQTLGFVVVAGWAMATTFIVLFAIDKTLGIRMSLADEAAGADWVEHRVKSYTFADRLEEAVEKVRRKTSVETLDSKEQEAALLFEMLKELLGSPAGGGGFVRNFAGGADLQIVQSIADVHAGTRHKPMYMEFTKSDSEPTKTPPPVDEETKARSRRSSKVHP